MQPRPTPTARLALSLAILVLASACNEMEAANPTGAPGARAAQREPTAERAKERSLARWAAVEKADWVAAFEFMTPDAKRDRPLGSYLQATQHHRYERMRVIEVLGLRGDTAYVRAGGLWTPQHPDMARVKLEPGQTLTQDIELVETWRWIGGDWYYQRPDRPEEFYEKHPDLRAAKTPPAAGG